MDTTTIAEVWKPVVGAEDRYEISSVGRVRVLNTPGLKFAGREIAQSFDTDGYYRITITIGNKSSTPRIHRLVALAFVGPKPTPFHQVNHKNGVKTDNRAENLEWVTASENALHWRRVLGPKKSRTPGPAPVFTPVVGRGRVLTTDSVLEIFRRSKGQDSFGAIARAHGISKTSVIRIVRGKAWTTVTGLPKRPKS